MEKAICLRTWNRGTPTTTTYHKDALPCWFVASADPTVDYSLTRTLQRVTAANWVCESILDALKRRFPFWRYILCYRFRQIQRSLVHIRRHCLEWTATNWERGPIVDVLSERTKHVNCRLNCWRFWSVRSKCGEIGANKSHHSNCVLRVICTFLSVFKFIGICCVQRSYTVYE